VTSAPFRAAASHPLLSQSDGPAGHFARPKKGFDGRLTLPVCADGEPAGEVRIALGRLQTLGVRTNRRRCALPSCTVRATGALQF
jgi:hypothetical protein